MGFQIVDKNSEPIPINEVDKEICKFWNVEYDKKHYATPYPIEHFKFEKNEFMQKYKWASQTNWFDGFAYIVHNKKLKSFDELLKVWEKDIHDFLKDDQFTLKELYPKEIELIEYFKKKGYNIFYVE